MCGNKVGNEYLLLRCGKSWSEMVVYEFLLFCMLIVIYVYYICGGKDLGMVRIREGRFGFEFEFIVCLVEKD